MLACDHCREKMADSNLPDSADRFPAFTVIGSLLGSLGAVVTGTILLVPVALVAGGTADILARRCGICDTEIDESEPAYQVLETLDDEAGERTFRSLASSRNHGQGRPENNYDRSEKTLSLPDSQTPSGQEVPLSHEFDLPQEKEEPTEFILDEIQGKLVPKEPLEPIDADLDFTFEGELGDRELAYPSTGLDPDVNNEGFDNPDGDALDLPNHGDFSLDGPGSGDDLMQEIP